MRALWRNKRQFYYCKYVRKTVVYDENGYETGESRITYEEPVLAMGNISAATGAAQVEQFGNFTAYDRVIVLDDPKFPMDENAVLFLEKGPEFDSNGKPLYDYIVRRAARSLNSVSYAVSKVSVS